MYNMDLGTNTPNYTDYVDNYDYYSGSIAFNPEGMAGLYKLTENFLNSLLPPNFLKEGMLVWTKSGNDEYYPALSQDFSYTDLFRDYWNVILVLVFIAFLSILIPIIGLIFSCCRCCGNCGAKAKPSNKKSDFYWKIILAIFLIACCAIFLFGVVSAFASNQQMQRGTNEFPNNIRNVYKDSVSYLQSTNDHAALLLSDNFREFKDALVAIIQASGKNFMEQIPIWANMSIINDIVNFAEALPDIQANLSILQQSTANLKDEGTTAVNGLNKLKVDITTTLSACSSLSQCKEMSQEINELKLNVDFSQLPNIDSAVTQMSGLDSTNILIAARTVKANVDTIQNNISTILTTTLNNVSEQVDTAGDTIVDNLRILTDVVHNLTQDMNDLNTTLETGYRYLNEYYPYFYYVGLTIACVLLLIIVFLFFGILLGIFAVRPEEGKKNCCTKNSASYFLMIGAVLIFLFTLFVGIITLVMLIVGTAVDRGICYPLRNPEDSTLISFIDEYLNITDQSGMNLQVNKILKNCFQNESIYNVFELKSKFDIDNLSSEFDVNSTIDTILKSIRDNLDSIFPSNNIILSTNDLDALNTLIAINPDIQLPIFESQLNQEFSSQNLTILAQSLQTVANAIQPIQPTVSEQIIAHVMEVETYNKNVLQPLISHATNTLDLAKTLDTQMKMNSTSFSEAIANFIKDVQTAQNQLNIDRDNIFEKASLDFGELIKELIYGYMNRVISVTKDDLGQCGPLSVAFNATLITVCDNIALPWNGFWVSLFMGFMTFVPILIISIWLASLYKRYKPSEQQFGREHDNYKNKNKKGKNGNDFKDYYQRDIPSHGDFYNNGSSNQNFNDYINDRRVNNPYNPRYDDMAPKFSRYPQESTRF